MKKSYFIKGLYLILAFLFLISIADCAVNNFIFKANVVSKVVYEEAGIVRYNFSDGYVCFEKVIKGNISCLKN